jgi:hypothetical protein
VRYCLGDRLVDRYLEFVAGRCRPNTLRAVCSRVRCRSTIQAGTCRAGRPVLRAREVFEHGGCHPLARGPVADEVIFPEAGQPADQVVLARVCQFPRSMRW